MKNNKTKIIIIAVIIIIAIFGVINYYCSLDENSDLISDKKDVDGNEVEFVLTEKRVAEMESLENKMRTIEEKNKVEFDEQVKKMDERYEEIQKIDENPKTESIIELKLEDFLPINPLEQFRTDKARI
ncbi:MAG: hypothetical protein ABIG87_02930 [Patescibacteria group bacterium]